MLINNVHHYSSITDVIYEESIKVVTRDTEIKFKREGKWHETTVGRILVLDATGIFIDYILDKNGVKKLMVAISEKYTTDQATVKLSKLQTLVFETSTKYGLSLCYDDFKKPDGYSEKLMETYNETLKVKGRERAVLWDKTINDLVEDWKLNNHKNPLHIMMQSGARVTDSQIRQMIVSKGLLTKMNGDLKEDAIYRSLSDGLIPSEYFLTCGPARRGLANNFFLVPASGYLERQLVNVARDLVITTESCGTSNGLVTHRKYSRGRYLLDGTLITPQLQRDLPEYVAVKSPTTCEHDNGLCAECCGLNPAYKKSWMLGTGIGVMSAQTLVEPTTQLSLRGKHTSGAVTLASFEMKVDNALADVIKLFGAASTTAVKVADSNQPAPEQFSGALYIERAAKLVDTIHEIYLINGISINRMFVETIVRAMSDFAEMADGSIQLRSRGFKDNNPKIRGVNRALRSHPSWLKAMEFAYINTHINTALTTLKPTMDLPSENLLMGDTHNI